MKNDLKPSCHCEGGLATAAIQLSFQMDCFCAPRNDKEKEFVDFSHNLRSSGRVGDSLLKEKLRAKSCFSRTGLQRSKAPASN